MTYANLILGNRTSDVLNTYQAHMDARTNAPNASRFPS